MCGCKGTRFAKFRFAIKSCSFLIEKKIAYLSFFLKNRTSFLFHLLKERFLTWIFLDQSNHSSKWPCYFSVRNRVPTHLYFLERSVCPLLSSPWAPTVPCLKPNPAPETWHEPALISSWPSPYGPFMIFSPPQCVVLLQSLNYNTTCVSLCHSIGCLPALEKPALPSPGLPGDLWFVFQLQPQVTILA